MREPSSKHWLTAVDRLAEVAAPALRPHGAPRIAVQRAQQVRLERELLAWRPDVTRVRGCHGLAQRSYRRGPQGLSMERNPPRECQSARPSCGPRRCWKRGIRVHRRDQGTEAKVERRKPDVVEGDECPRRKHGRGAPAEDACEPERDTDSDNPSKSPRPGQSHRRGDSLRVDL
jgi:hypothetical protein